MLTEFATFDQIRAVLGVSDEEIEDADLNHDLYETYLQLELDDIDTVLVATFRTASALPPSGRTTAQQRLVDVTRLFSAYAVAKQLLVSLPYYAEKRIADGRADKERIANPFEATQAGVLAAFSDLRVRLGAALSAVTNADSFTRLRRTYAVGTGLATDPVTNE